MGPLVAAAGRANGARSICARASAPNRRGNRADRRHPCHEFSPRAVAAEHGSNMRSDSRRFMAASRPSPASSVSGGLQATEKIDTRFVRASSALVVGEAPDGPSSTVSQVGQRYPRGSRYIRGAGVPQFPKTAFRTTAGAASDTEGTSPRPCALNRLMNAVAISLAGGRYTREGISPAIFWTRRRDCCRRTQFGVCDGRPRGPIRPISISRTLAGPGPTGGAIRDAAARRPGPRDIEQPLPAFSSNRDPSPRCWQSVAKWCSERQMACRRALAFATDSGDARLIVGGYRHHRAVANRDGRAAAPAPDGRG